MEKTFGKVCVLTRGFELSLVAKKEKVNYLLSLGLPWAIPYYLLSEMAVGSGAFSFKLTFNTAEVPGGQWFFSSNERKEVAEFAVEVKW